MSEIIETTNIYEQYIDEMSEYNTGVVCTKCNKGNFFELFTEDEIENGKLTSDYYKCKHCGLIIDEKMFRKIITNDLGASTIVACQEANAPTEHNPHEGQNDW